MHEAGPTGPEGRFYLMRGLLIAQDLDIQEGWRQALEAEWIDPVQTGDGLEAIRLATPDGFDLIVIAGSLGAVDRHVFSDLLRAGLFGAVPPPIIVHVNKFGDILSDSEDVFAGCVVVEACAPAGFTHAIDQAFASLDRPNLGRGDHYA